MRNIKSERLLEAATAAASRGALPNVGSLGLDEGAREVHPLGDPRLIWDMGQQC